MAIWLPPGAEPDGNAIIAALDRSVLADKPADTFSVLEQMDAAHPKDPHRYLPWMGVDPAPQGAGLGSELLEQCLAHVDAITAPPSLKRPTRERCPSTSARASVSSASHKPERARP